MAIIGAGCVFTGTNPSYTQFELSHHFKTACAKFIITEPEMLETVKTATKATGIPCSHIWIFDTQNQEIPEGFFSWKKLLGYGEEDWVPFDDEDVSKTTTAARLFSSGTTGLPKAAALSHYNLVAQHTLVNEVQESHYKVGIDLISWNLPSVPLAQPTSQSLMTDYVLSVRSSACVTFQCFMPPWFPSHTSRHCEPIMLPSSCAALRSNHFYRLFRNTESRNSFSSHLWHSLRSNFLSSEITHSNLSKWRALAPVLSTKTTRTHCKKSWALKLRSTRVGGWRKQAP